MRNIFLCIVLGVFLSACTPFWKHANPETVVQKDYKETLAQASSKIKDTPEFEECMRPQAEMCISSIGMRLAQEKQDIGFCDELSRDSDKQSCKFIITTMHASRTKDVHTCDTLSGTNQESCQFSVITGLAKEKGDPKLCGSLGSVSGEKVTGNLELKDRCIVGVLMMQSHHTSEDCRDITTVDAKNSCTEMVKNQSH